MRWLRLLVVMIAAAGCEKAKEKDPRYDGAMPVVFGDCAGPTVSWVSGPRPQPFTPAQADAVNVAAAEPPKQAPIDAGTADASSDRAEGQYKMKRDLVRQQAIEQAGNFGVLGATAPQQGGAFASLTGTGDTSSGFDDQDIYGELLGNEVGETNTVGGGTGWGTIGTGGYGTISHALGSGVGGGRGGMHARNGAAPTVSIGQLNTQGDLDKGTIRRVVKRNLDKIRYCYEKQLLVSPKLAGTVSVQFFITANGKVSSATADGVDPEVSKCVANVIHGIVFPSPKSGGVQVSYPFTFRIADEGAPLRAAGAGSAEAANGDPAVPATRHLFRTDPINTTYQPGAANPLRAEQAPLTECFRKNPKHYGAIVVELGANALVHNLDDELARTCVLEIAKRVKPSAPQRCSIAFGEMPAVELPTIGFATDTIKLEGKQLAMAVSDAPTIPELVTAIEARVTAQTASKAPLGPIYGPLLIRAADATPMKLVYRVVHSVLAAGDDLTLAAHRGTEWQPLPQLALPVAPVPLGTGGTWNHVKRATRRLGLAHDDERVVMSIVLTKKQLWVGLSRVNEFLELPRDASQPQKLVDALQSHKASAFFADRTDVEIGADDDVSYSDLVSVIDAVTKAGFTDWILADEQALSAHPSL